MSRADDVTAAGTAAAVPAGDGLQRLLTANRSILGELSLPAVLRRVIEAACDLTGARYGALGVIGADGGLDQFVHVGMDAAQVAAIGSLPRGHGLLGALIAHPGPLRLGDIDADPRSAGFPANHPRMKSFLGVPITLRDEVYGNLYLTESWTGAFTAQDAELAVSLAGTAAIAIENARLYRNSQRRQDWLEASTEITRRLLTRPGDHALQDIAQKVMTLADADVVMVVLPVGDGHRLRVEVATGTSASELIGRVYPDTGTLSRTTIDTNQPIRIASVNNARDLRVHLADLVDIGPVIALPLAGSGRPRGAMLAGRAQGRAAFSLAELDMAATFAGHAAVALELADARSTQDRLLLLEERDRIARDLHDHVIQRLFAAGLTVQSVLSGRASNSADRLGRVVGDIDDTIRQIRASIFELQTRPGPPAGARNQLLETVDEIAITMDQPPVVRFDGPIDELTSEVLQDLQAVLREALSNAARHARADAVSVDLMVSDGAVTLDVADDGIGIGHAARSSGLANMRYRAERYGGQFVISPGTEKGTTVRWKVPLE